MPPRYRDRRDAGRALVPHLSAYAGRDDVIVLALPRGGVPVAEPVADALAAPLDVYLVRKLGVPGHEELAMGAIADGGGVLRNHEVIAQVGVSEADVDRVAAAEREELHRRATRYRGDRPPPEIDGRTAIVVDDGLATGATMRAAVAAIRGAGASRVVVAVPVGAEPTVARVAQEADEVVCPLRPRDFLAVGAWYDDFSQTSDDEVRRILARHQ